MLYIYNFFIQIAWLLLQFIALFNPKIKLFVTGRKNTFSRLNQQLLSNKDVIWIHVASLGEFEQGLPIIEKLKSEHPNKQILVTFFSPSGYEVKKNTKAADVVCYIPLDSINNAVAFLNLTKPKLVIFIKYEIWPNFLNEIKKRNIPSLLVSAIFNKDQVYFKIYGGFMRKALKTFNHIFVQDETSKTLLQTIQINNVSISGDTRFDRVSQILERDNHNEYIKNFKQDQLCFVVGSSWAEDEKIIVPTINDPELVTKWIIAPHNINIDHIEKLRKSIQKKCLLYSEKNLSDMQNYDVLIIDNIGLLTQIYSYADLAYVGGGFSTGLHNTLEPAVFGIPVIIGPQYTGFKEAEELVANKGIKVITTAVEFEQLLYGFLDQQNNNLLKETGAITSAYVAQNKGASIQITNYIRKLF